MNEPIDVAVAGANAGERLADAADLASDRILARIGQLTRTLRDSMRELGLDKHVEKAAEVVPDARDRLRYVVAMTEQAAERVLTAIEVAKPVQGACGRRPPRSTRAGRNGTRRRSSVRKCAA